MSVQRVYEKGDRVGYQTILGPHRTMPQPTGGRPEYLVRCDCGDERWVQTGNLRSGSTLSCQPCSAKRRRGEQVERRCQWCGRDRAAGAGFKHNFASCCSACYRTITRNGRWPCGKPRRQWITVGRPEDEHVCPKCKPWPRGSTA